MNQSILVENQKKRLDIRLPLLICFAMYAAWQMGFIYFSGTALSVDGRTPLPVSLDNMTLAIAAGYIFGIGGMLAAPRFTVWFERIAGIASLVSALMLFIPFSPEVLTAIIYFHAFCCCFMIVFETGIIVNLFTEKSAMLLLTLGYVVANAADAIMQNDFYPVPFSVFRIVIVIMLALLLVFFFKMPAKTWPRYVGKSDKMVCPKKLFTGIYILVTLGCLMILFGTAVSENTTHGVFTNYMASAVGGIIVFVLWKLKIVTPLRTVTALVGISALGFIVAIVSLYVPSLSLIACALLGVGNMVCWLNPFWGLLLAKRYPSRFITPIIIGIAFGTVLVQSALLEALRDNVQVLYAVYLLIAVALAVVYLILEPYLLYSSREQLLATEHEGAKASKAGNLGLNAFDRLNEAELTIADRIMRGYSNREIAAELNYSENTIKSYRKDLYSKLQIHSKRELFELAEKQNAGKGGDTV